MLTDVVNVDDGANDVHVNGTSRDRGDGWPRTPSVASSLGGDESDATRWIWTRVAHHVLDGDCDDYMEPGEVVSVVEVRFVLRLCLRFCLDSSSIFHLGTCRDHG